MMRLLLSQLLENKAHIEGDRIIPPAVEMAKLEGKRISVNKEAVIEILLEAA